MLKTEETTEVGAKYVQLERAGINRYEKISYFANTRPVFLKENEKIEAAVYKIIETGHRSIPIVSKNNNVVGIVTTPDIINAFLKNQSFSDDISTIMTREVIFVHHDDPIGLVLQKMKISRRGRLPVIKNRKLVGVISEYDIMKYFAHYDLRIKTSEVMTKKPLFITHEVSTFDVLRILANSKYRRLPVVEHGKVVGIVTASDMLKYLRNSDFNASELFHPIDSLLRKKVFSVGNDKDLSEAIRLMLIHDVSGLVVLDVADRLEGIITERDVINQII